MIPASALAYLQALETAAGRGRWCLVTKRICDCTEGCKKMKPRIRVKAQGRAIFVGKDFEAAADAAGDIKVKPKKKHRTLNQEYAAKNRKRFKGIAK